MQSALWQMIASWDKCRYQSEMFRDYYHDYCKLIRETNQLVVLSGNEYAGNYLHSLGCLPDTPSPFGQEIRGRTLSISSQVHLASSTDTVHANSSTKTAPRHLFHTLLSKLYDCVTWLPPILMTVSWYQCWLYLSGFMTNLLDATASTATRLFALS